MSWMSVEKPLTYRWAVEHMAYDQGKADGRKEAMDEATKRDRDETRRLLYMALYVARTDRYELVGTLVNALVHHGSGLTADEVGAKVLAAIEDGDTTWLREQVDRLTAELDADPR